MPKPSQVICRAGNDIFEVETICTLPKIKFFETIATIQKIKDRKHQANFKQFLGSVLVKISVLAGIKNEIDSFIKTDIVNMLTTTYGYFAIEEIWKAFELERYSVFETKTDHYQLFDSNYISAVLKKYNQWKINEKKILNFEPPKPALPEITESEKENIIKKDIQHRYEDYLKTDIIEGVYFYFFDFLVEQGKIKITNNPKNIEWFQIRLSVAKSELLSNLKSKKGKSKDDFRQIKNIINEIENNNSKTVLNRAKEIIIHEYFQKQADDWVAMIF